MPFFTRGSRRSTSEGSEEINGKSTETGDAYWYWTPIEVDPIPLQKGLSDLVPLAKQRRAVADALDSFGTAYPEDLREAMREGWEEIMEPSPGDPGSGTESPGNTKR